jgi:hypothetical protein
MIDVFRASFLNVIRPLWNSQQILKYFSVEATVEETSFSDIPDAFFFMVKCIANTIHSMIGFSEFETYTIINARAENVVANFILPTKKGL